MTTLAATRLARQESDIELFGQKSLMNPYGDYNLLRDLGRIVYLTRYDAWVVTRYDEVVGILSDPETFSPDQGPGLNKSPINDNPGSIISSSGAVHAAQRRVILASIGPGPASGYKTRIEEAARNVVASVTARGEFDAIKDFAEVMPTTAMTNALGLQIDQELRVDLLHWATDVYNCFGPEGTYEETRPSFNKLFGFCMKELGPEKFQPGTIGAQTWAAVSKGLITDVQAVAVLTGYLIAGTDTTSTAIGGMMMHFAQRPELWELLCREPALIPSAVLEGLRLESPVQWFARRTTRDVDFDGIIVPQGSRVMHNYGAANRDERHYPNPDNFDVRRNPTDNLVFGYGLHGCIGKHFSNLETHALFAELAKRVKRIEPVGKPVRRINNLIRSWESFPVRVVLN